MASPIASASEQARRRRHDGPSRSEPQSERPERGRFCERRALVASLRLARVGDDHLELRHGQDAGHAEFADDEGRRALEAECRGLIVVAREDGVDRLGIGREIAVEAIDVDTGGCEQLADARFGGGDDVEDARWLRQHIGKVGFIQLGWAYQGSMFLYEASTEWYEQYQHLLEFSEEIGGFTLGESSPDDEP